MLVIFKFLVLPLLVGLAIYLSTIEAASLNALYQTIGMQLDIDWIKAGGNYRYISDMGHGVIYFTITLISLVCFRKYYRRTIGLIILLAAANEIAQILILTREANWNDFAYGVTGITLALIVYIVTLESGSTPRNKLNQDKD